MSEALENYSKAIELLEGLTAADAANAQYRVRLAGALANVARIHAGLAARTSEPEALK